MPHDYAKVWNVCAKESSENIIIDYLLYIDYSGDYKQDYQEGESFDPTGITINAYHADGTVSRLLPYNNEEKNTNTWRYFPTGPLTYRNTYITAYYSYYDKTASVNIPINVIKQYIEMPKLDHDEFDYNGLPQGPIVICKDEEFLTYDALSQFLGTNADEYKITIRINTPGIYFEGTEDLTEVTLTWKINKIPRPLSLSVDEIIFDESNSYTSDHPENLVTYTVHLNYPGDDRYEVINTTASQYFSMQWFPTSKSFSISCYNPKSTVRQEFRFRVPESDNYLQSEVVTFTGIIMIWEWGKEDSSAAQDLADTNWIYGLMNAIDVNGKALEEWIGKKKFFKFDGPVYTFDYDYNLLFEVVAVNQECPNSITWRSAVTSKKTSSFALRSDTDLMYPSKHEDDYMVLLEDYTYCWEHEPWYADTVLLNQVLYNSAHDINFPTPEYLVTRRRYYWNGNNLELSNKVGFFIPSAAELGINNEMMPEYVGGTNSEYGEGLHEPYQYYIDNERRKVKAKDSNTPVKYWTRSTVDDGNRADNGINMNQIIIDENGEPQIYDKTNTTDVHIFVMFTMALDPEGRNTFTNGEDI